MFEGWQFRLMRRGYPFPAILTPPGHGSSVHPAFHSVETWNLKWSCFQHVLDMDLVLRFLRTESPSQTIPWYLIWKLSCHAIDQITDPQSYPEDHQHTVKSNLHLRRCHWEWDCDLICDFQLHQRIQSCLCIVLCAVWQFEIGQVLARLLS